MSEEPTLPEGTEGPAPKAAVAPLPEPSPRRRLKSIARMIGAIGFVAVVFGWFHVHDFPFVEDKELLLAPKESREFDVAEGYPTGVVVSGWIAPGWDSPSGDDGEISALDSTGKKIAGVHWADGPYSFGGAIDRVTIRSGGAPARVTIRVVSEETAARIRRSQTRLELLLAVLLIPFLSVCVAPLARWMARDQSTLRLRRRTGWIGIVIVGAPVACSMFRAVISGLEGREAVAPVEESIEPLLSWSVWLWVSAVVVLALASLERRAIGGRMLEMRSSAAAVFVAAITIAVAWYAWDLIASLASDIRLASWPVTSTADFPAAVLLALSAGITEEIVFRGFLLTRLRELTGGALLPLLVTSVAFGVVHMYDSGWHALHAGIFGLLLGLVTLGSRNLFPAILVHVAWDLLVAVDFTFDAVWGFS